MNKILWLVLAALLFCIGAPAIAQSMDPVKPGELQLAQKVLTLQRWSEAVDQQLDDAVSSTNGILAEGTVYIGNASNLATSQAITGDIGITTGGVVSITTGSIVNADLAAAAAIAHTKLAPVAPGYLLVGNASSQAVAVAVTGDIAVSTSGVSSVASGVVVDADINAAAAIASTKLAGLALTDTNTTVDATTSTPLFAGQSLVGPVSNKEWVSEGTTTNDWILVN